MGITIEFRDFEEMKAFARELLGAAPQPTALTPVPAVAPPQVAPAPAPVAMQQPAAAVPAPTLAPAAPTVPTQAPVTPAVPAVPTMARTYTMDDLARAGMGLMDAGRQNDLLQLLARFGVDNLPALPPEQYGAFATALREMGAKI